MIGRKVLRLFFLGSANGAGFGTSAAAYASISVDDVLAISLGDRLGGATSGASATSYTRVINFVCHDRYTSLYSLKVLYH